MSLSLARNTDDSAATGGVQNCKKKKDFTFRFVNDTDSKITCNDWAELVMELFRSFNST